MFAAAPNWADQMSAIATLVAASATVLTLIAVVVSAILGFRQLRDSRTRHIAETVAGWTKEWTSDPVREAKIAFSSSTADAHRELAEKAFGPDRTDDDVQRLLLVESIPNFFEGIGFLTKEKAVSVDLVGRYWGPVIVEVWDHWSSAAGFLRTKEGIDAFADLQDLAEALRQRSGA